MMTLQEAIETQVVRLDVNSKRARNILNQIKGMALLLAQGRVKVVKERSRELVAA